MGNAEPATRVPSAESIGVSVLSADATHTGKTDHQEPDGTSALKKPLRRIGMMVRQHRCGRGSSSTKPEYKLASIPVCKDLLIVPRESI